jgi:16S rRNA (guanine966-N2)-methyltransferase
LRIIGGTARGRKLFSPPLHEKCIRPTSDRAREALFNIIGNRIVDATVLDLFAGTGALGLEAFSRNARFIVFIDNNRLALQLIKKNILLCLNGYRGDCGIRVVQHDLTKNIPENKLPRETRRGFDIIFADPPYARNISFSVLDFINNSSLLTQNGLLIIEEKHTVELPSSLSTLELIDRRVYGGTAFCFYRSSAAA